MCAGMRSMGGHSTLSLRFSRMYTVYRRERGRSLSASDRSHGLGAIAWEEAHDGAVLNSVT